VALVHGPGPELIAQGYSNAQIAAKLTIAPGTVANQVAHILDHLGYANRAQIAAWEATRRTGSSSALDVFAGSAGSAGAMDRWPQAEPSAADEREHGAVQYTLTY
jgi:hypothetical protein